MSPLEESYRQPFTHPAFAHGNGSQRAPGACQCRSGSETMPVAVPASDGPLTAAQAITEAERIVRGER